MEYNAFDQMLVPGPQIPHRVTGWLMNYTSQLKDDAQALRQSVIARMEEHIRVCRKHIDKWSDQDASSCATTGLHRLQSELDALVALPAPGLADLHALEERLQDYRAEVIEAYSSAPMDNDTLGELCTSHSSPIKPLHTELLQCLDDARAEIERLKTTAIEHKRLLQKTATLPVSWTGDGLDTISAFLKTLRASGDTIQTEHNKTDDKEKKARCIAAMKALITNSGDRIALICKELKAKRKAATRSIEKKQQTVKIVLRGAALEALCTPTFESTLKKANKRREMLNGLIPRVRAIEKKLKKRTADYQTSKYAAPDFKTSAHLELCSYTERWIQQYDADLNGIIAESKFDPEAATERLEEYLTSSWQYYRMLSVTAEHPTENKIALVEVRMLTQSDVERRIHKIHALLLLINKNINGQMQLPNAESNPMLIRFVGDRATYTGIFDKLVSRYEASCTDGNPTTRKAEQEKLAVELAQLKKLLKRLLSDLRKSPSKVEEWEMADLNLVMKGLVMEQPFDATIEVSVLLPAKLVRSGDLVYKLIWDSLGAPSEVVAALNAHVTSIDNGKSAKMVDEFEKLDDDDKLNQLIDDHTDHCQTLNDAAEQFLETKREIAMQALCAHLGVLKREKAQMSRWRVKTGIKIGSSALTMATHVGGAIASNGATLSASTYAILKSGAKIIGAIADHCKSLETRHQELRQYGTIIDKAIASASEDAILQRFKESKQKVGMITLSLLLPELERAMTCIPQYRNLLMQYTADLTRAQARVDDLRKTINKLINQQAALPDDVDEDSDEVKTLVAALEAKIELHTQLAQRLQKHRNYTIAQQLKLNRYDLLLSKGTLLKGHHGVTNEEIDKKDEAQGKKVKDLKNTDKVSLGLKSTKQAAGILLTFTELKSLNPITVPSIPVDLDLNQSVQDLTSALSVLESMV